MVLSAILAAAALGGAAQLTARPLDAAMPQWLFLGTNSTGCAGGTTRINVRFVDVTPNMFQDTIVEANGQIFMDELGFGIGPASPLDDIWGFYDSNDRGLQTATFPLPPDTIINVTLTLRDSNKSALWITRLQFICNKAGVTQLSSGPPEPTRSGPGSGAGAIGLVAGQQARENRARVAAAAPAPAVSPPSTGTGAITPPSTGSGGLR